MTAEFPSVLVLAGGPDAERDVSLESARAVASALREAGFTVHEQTIDAPALGDLRAMPGNVVFPALHGPFGEGGPLQDLLEILGRPYVGARPRPARLAMDKIATKTLAATLGLAVTPSAVFNPGDALCPLPLPVVVKPVREGSTIGLHLCRTEPDYAGAHQATRAAGRPAMIEPLIFGRELTVGVLGGAALPIIEIRPASGHYDYAAKYERDDTRYLVAPPLPPGVGERMRSQAAALANAIGATDLARVDFILDENGTPWLLELNTMPGFTSHSLVPMAARAAGVEMPELCARLVRMARPGVSRPAAEGARA
jgi:D-alanine-D-alanine ligase